MLDKLTFTPDHQKYDTLELLNSEITKNEFSLNFVRELHIKRGISRLAHLLVLPINDILRFEDYKVKDIHYLLKVSDNIGISFGKLPDWYAEAIGQNEKAELIRFLHCQFNYVSWPYSPASFTREAVNYLAMRGVERVYQLLLLNKRELDEAPKRLGKKILNSYDYFIRWNDLGNFKLTVLGQDES